MNQYTYDGPVMLFDKCIAHRWIASTYAASESKARSNLTYRFKKQNNLVSNCKISLPERIMMVNRENSHGIRKEKVYERTQLQIEFP